MSCKKAWYLIDTMNGCFREPVVVASKGGSSRAGTQLSEMGQTVLDLYRDIESEATRAAERHLNAFARLIVEQPPKQ